MAKRVEVSYEGQMVPAEQLEFEAEKEPWTVYRLEDGSTLKFKVVLTTIARLLDRYKPDGEPIYIFGMGGVPVVDAPPALWRQASQLSTQKER